MSKFYGNVVLVTGASSGIGKSIAEYLAQMGFRVYGTSRKAGSNGNKQNSEENSNNSFKTSAAADDSEVLYKNGGFLRMLQMDVCNEESIRTAVEHILDTEGELGIVINNAGIGIAGSIEDTSHQEALLQIDTNFFGVHRVIRQVLPSMRKHGRGLIINISSVGAVFPIPFQGMYVASKAAVEGMSGALRNELRPFGIKVSLVEPGDTKTGFTKNRLFVEAGKDSVYADQSRKSIEVMERDEENGPDPVVVARVVGKLVNKKNPPVCVAVGLQYKLLVFLKRLVPKRLESYIVSKMYGM